MTKVRTVLGDIDSSELGFTMAHEHILTNPQGSGSKAEQGHHLDSVEKAIQMLNEFKAVVVDVSLKQRQNRGDAIRPVWLNRRKRQVCMWLLVQGIFVKSMDS